MKATYQDNIRLIAEDREVDVLLHFTQATNLPGILHHGLLPRTELAAPGYAASARYRLDDTPEAVSVSISRVNEGMFASKRAKSGHRDWVVLVLSPVILWTHSCRFCWRNAAKKAVKDHRGRRDGPWAFNEMFVGSDQARDGLARCFPTDPEAEVQVFEPIAAEYILGAVVGRPGMVDAVQELLDGRLEDRPVVVDDW